MKVTLYMAISTNGYITYKEDDTAWVSEEDFAGQEKVAKRIGNIVYGKVTYDIGIKEDCLPVPGCLNIVVTNKHKEAKTNKDFLFTNASPKEIINMLSEKGFKEVLVAGGAKLNHSFIKDSLIDEIYLDIEPVILGKGKPLFTPEELKLNLELIEINKLNINTIQMHYKVKK